MGRGLLDELLSLEASSKEPLTDRIPFGIELLFIGIFTTDPSRSRMELFRFTQL